MSGQSSGHTHQVSATSRLPTGPPSNNEYTPTVEAGDDPAPTDSHLHQHEREGRLGEDAVAARDEPSHRRHKARSSGGFLLQASPDSTSNTRHPRDTEPDISEIARGKRKVGEGDIIVPKRGSGRHRHYPRTSLGGSPLATEVVDIQPSHKVSGSKVLDANRRSSLQSNNTQSTHSGLTSNGTSTGSPSINDVAQKSERSTIGLDTDPAQIVTLALNLSESRRRNLNSGGLIAPRDAIGARRLVSPVQPTLTQPNTGGGSLRQHLQQQRHISRNISPRSSRSAASKGADSPASQGKAIHRHSSLLPDFAAGLNENVLSNATDATLARAEKAKVTFELFYEYRRLLQHLPVLPVPQKGKSTSKPSGYPAQGLGRVYNPLQYIRNRKLRIREREPLDAEGDGWNSIENVRAWVDTVASEREDGLSRVDTRFPLPPFQKSTSGSPQVDDLQAQDKFHPTDAQVKKPGRPRMDWIVAPWDLLADVNWLHQGDNIKRIVDREGQPLLPKADPFHEDGPRTSKERTRGSARQPTGFPRQINSSPERLRASLESFRSDSKERVRRGLETGEPKSPRSDDDGFQRKGRWPRKLMRSRSPSSSGESHQANGRRHRPGLDHLGTRDDLDDAALGKHMADLLAKEANGEPEAIQSAENHVAKEGEAEYSQPNNGVANRLASGPAKRRPSTPRRMKTDMPAADKYTTSARASLDEQRLHHRRMSSDDFDSTAPNSPTTSDFIPSIAINLSPPESPQTSTVSPVKKTLPGRIGSFRRNRSRSVNRRAASENNAAIDSGTSTDVSRQTTSESQLHSMLLKERSLNPGNGFLSPTKTDAPGNRYRPLENNPMRSIKDTSGPDSRFRGIFKSGRIAEIVGNEVSRVGDIFWKKEGNSVSEINSEASSLAPEESDMDEGDLSGIEGSPRADLSRVTTNTEESSKLSRASTNNVERPKYHISNLPSFRSPFSKEEQPSKPTKATPEHDHITRQQLALRERGRSSRFDRLAPPRIDMRGISPSPSRSPTRKEADLDDDSGEGSRSRSIQRIRSADRKLNAILAIPGRVTGVPALTGLSDLESRSHNSQERPRVESKRHWSIADQSVSTVQETVTKRDIARVRALLLSSGVKANEIARRAEEIPERPSPFLLDVMDLFKGSIPEVSRSKECVVAARILVSTIDTTTQRLRDTAEHFSRKTVESLHEQIKAIDERVTYKLTPLVRASTDDADDFSTELTTTHTLAVKQLNDSIDEILRRRRRRLRWVRRGGWAILEWTLLGIMWMIWFLVVIVRLVRGVIHGLGRAVRWVFWL